MSSLRAVGPNFVQERGSRMQHAMKFIIQGRFVVDFWTHAAESEAIS